MDIIALTELLRKAVMVMIKAGSPPMIAALVVGLVISVLQAVTQIQEQSLAFIPKVLAVFVTLIFLFPYMFSVLSDLTHEIFDLALRLS
ncbi:flagellar biosynthetic protein FliQ [Candidatus Bodocaedibacter vickermanii]|uniref:Flagellar biosynthetic protein FliQ n=1 Tax=Candidatus Bodocaedibacter vickermanii TaxID=2741701 RepID=A0A7L9RUQ7_9PROT|nr:flagellar biosynthetic protein FliQ [Candidatus Paracaedibacteraceae bacterium 'Lake Konstanz']